MSIQCASARSKRGLAYVEQGQAGAEPTTTSRRGGPRVDDEGRVREGGRKGKCGKGGEGGGWRRRGQGYHNDAAPPSVRRRADPFTES